MDAFLSELSQDGEQISHGVFTMDISKAQLKLAKYQLASFEQFVDFLISTLAASPATHLFVESSPGKFFTKGSTNLTFVDWSLTAEDIRAIGISSLGGSERRDLRYLAILLSALASKHSLVLRSHHSDECIALKVTPQQVDVLDPEDLSDFDGRSDSYVSLEVGADVSKIVAQSCSRLARWSAKTIEISGNWYARGFNAQLQLKDALAFLQQSGPGDVPVINSSRDKTRIVESAAPGSHPKFLALTANPSEEKNLGLWLLVDGLAYRCPRPLPRVCGYIVANELKRDLSYQSLVQNEAFESVFKELRDAASQLLVDLVTKDITLKAEDILSLVDLVSDLKRDLDMDFVEKLLFEKSGTLTATTHPASLKVLLARLENCSGSDATPLLEQYRRQISQTRRLGRLVETRDLVQASGSCRQALGQSARTEDELLALVQVLTGRKAELAPCGEPIASFLGTLLSWQGDGMSLPDWENSEIHPTWYLPLSLYAQWDLPGELELPAAMTEKYPAWLKLMGHLRANRGERALAMVQALDELRFDLHRQAWNELFWTFYRGRVSWQTQIRLRVELTKSYMRDPNRADVDVVSRFIQSTGFTYLEKSTESFAACANYLAAKSYFGGDFWPEFFTVMVQGRRQFPREVRGAWVKLLAQALLGAMLQSNSEASPLLQPLEFPLRREPDTL